MTGPRGDALRHLDASPALAREALGTELAIGQTIACIIPGHNGRGRLERKHDGRFVYRCDCDEIERSLTEVYLARVTGVKKKRSPQAFVLWKLRLAAKAGLIRRPAVRMPALPDRQSDVVTKVYDGLILFLQLRALTDQGDQPAFTFARGFAAEWCRLSLDEARAGVAQLIDLRVLLLDGKTPVSNGREANLYRLGLHEE